MLLLFSSSVMSDSLQPHGLSLTRLPGPWISQARILEWVVIFFCRRSSPSRDQTSTSCWQADSFPLSSVQFSSVTQSCPILCNPMDCSTNSRSSLKLMSTESVMLSNHFILSRPLLLPPSIFHSIRVFSNEFVLRISWPKYWSFSFNISPSNEHLGLIFFRMDWLALLAVQETLKSLLQHHSSKALIL